MATMTRHKPSTNTAAVVTLAASPPTKRVIGAIYWSYQLGTLVGGGLTVASPSGTTIFEMGIPVQGPNSVIFPDGLEGAAGEAMIVTLAAGDTSVQGILNVSVRA